MALNAEFQIDSRTDLTLKCCFLTFALEMYLKE